MSETAQSICSFWFGTLDDPFDAPGDRKGIWFKQDDATDEALRARFLDVHTRVTRGEHDAWADEARGRLALVIVLDQLSRNMFRNTAGAFASDPRAQALSLEGIARGHDAELRPIERPFLYMPLMHAEDRAVQAQCVALFTKLAGEVPEEHRSLYANYLDYAERHRAIVDRFGRYPHRNAIVGRASTPEEEAFLKEPGSSF